MMTADEYMKDLTALVLTFNEAPNIERTLNSISWAGQIIVLDSGSTDETLSIARQYSQVRIVQREFSDFADQCNYGLSLIDTPWTLSIDADYVFPKDSQRLLASALEGAYVGYEASFDYWIHGKAVKGSILPKRTVLYRTDKARYRKDGHGHRVNVQGTIGTLNFRIAHDDRKPLTRWCHSQLIYAKQEARKLSGSSISKLTGYDRIRRTIFLAPVLVFALCYVFRGGFMSGWRGLFYALQRFYAELLLSLVLLDQRLAGRPGSKTNETPDR